MTNSLSASANETSQKEEIKHERVNTDESANPNEKGMDRIKIHPSAFQKFLHGRASKQMQAIYFFSLLVIYLLVSLIAQSLYPTPYSPLLHKISAQGGITSNPQGYILWNITTISMGLLLIPHFLYLSHRLHFMPKLLNTLATRLAILGSIAVSFVGLFPREYVIPHTIPAAIALYGWLIAFNLFTSGLAVRKSYQSLTSHLQQYKIWILMVITILLDLIVFANLLRTILPPSALTWVTNTAFLTYPPWQWAHYLALFAWMITSFLLL